VHAEEAGGAGPVPVLTLEGPQHIRLLEAVPRVLEREGHRSPVASRALVDLVDGEVHGKIVEADHRPRGEGDAALDDVLELTHVARPVIGLEGGQGPARDAADVLLELLGVLAEKVLDEDGNVGLARAQGRDGDGDHVEAVVQVLAEGARAHGGAQIHVGRREHAQIDGNGMRAAQPLDLALLEGAQQLGLEIDAQRAHLVQEQGAAVGQLELAHLACVGPREGALLVPEQLGFEEGVRDGGEVDGHEGLGAPRSPADGWRAPPAPCPCRSPPQRGRWPGVCATCAISS
jgi:hypothetical protein